MREIFHALVLDLHQPSGNLSQLLDTTAANAVYGFVKCVDLRNDLQR